MDFLKELALPQSLEHYHLVVLLAAISSMVFVPYVMFVLGSTIAGMTVAPAPPSIAAVAASSLITIIVVTALAAWFGAARPARRDENPSQELP